MGSAEIADAGRLAGGRSNFSQMCTLFSQYLKQNGSFGDLKLGLTHSLENKGSLVETMNLLPKIEKSGPGSASGSGDLKASHPLSSQQAADATIGRNEILKKPNRCGVEAAQMTIFYAGQVMVFDDFPADKAKEILMLASNSSAATLKRPISAFSPLHAAHSPAESATGVHRVAPTSVLPKPRPTQPPLDSDLPIARKNSLARFLEKRKDRITANAPYPARKPEVAPPKLTGAATNEPWLGLAPELIQHH